MLKSLNINFVSSFIIEDNKVKSRNIWDDVGAISLRQRNNHDKILWIEWRKWCFYSVNTLTSLPMGPYVYDV
jgi:hypothetical protein